MVAVAATGACFNDWLVSVAPVVTFCDRGWEGMKSFRCMGHVRIVLGRGNGIGIFSCNICALMGLVVGAILGGLLVGGCTGLRLRGLGSGKAMLIFSCAGFGGQMVC